jgi:hypothetical protein
MRLLLKSAENSSLLLAVRSNRISTVNFLMDNFAAANVQTKDQDGNTALHLAALHGYCNLVKHLVEDFGAGLKKKISFYCSILGTVFFCYMKNLYYSGRHFFLKKLSPISFLFYSVSQRFSTQITPRPVFSKSNNFVVFFKNPIEGCDSFKIFHDLLP